MPTTVYFATNRVVANAADAVNGYPAKMVSPSVAMTYGTAFVDRINIGTNAQGAVSQIEETTTGGFSQQAIDDISAPGRNLLVFIHGFDNTFSDAITRAAFNREWLAASGVAAADTTVIAFSWPSKGELVSFPILDDDYRFDQNMARSSALHLMTFFANLEPILTAARKSGRRAILLAHSMGNLALEGAVESWFLHGNGNAAIFDQAILAAGDCGYDTFGQPNLARLSGLIDLAGRIGIYYSHVDYVLKLSVWVNRGAERLGQDGPRHRTDTAEFPPAQYLMQDCTAYQDYGFNFLTSHQYYRQSPQVRAIIAATIG